MCLALKASNLCLLQYSKLSMRCLAWSGACKEPGELQEPACTFNDDAQPAQITISMNESERLHTGLACTVNDMLCFVAEYEEGRGGVPDPLGNTALHCHQHTSQDRPDAGRTASSIQVGACLTQTLPRPYPLHEQLQP